MIIYNVYCFYNRSFLWTCLLAKWNFRRLVQKWQMELLSVAVMASQDLLHHWSNSSAFPCLHMYEMNIKSRKETPYLFWISRTFHNFSFYGLMSEQLYCRNNIIWRISEALLLENTTFKIFVWMYACIYNLCSFYLTRVPQRLKSIKGKAWQG